MKILFIGCGNMGIAIVRGMLRSGYFSSSDIEVVLPSDSPHHSIVADELKLTIHEEFPSDMQWDAILFAVKPQVLPAILSHYQNADQKTLIISIAAGKSIGFFEKFFPHNPIIRVMPNINLLVERGASAAVGNTIASKSHFELVEHIFAKAGYFTVLKDEKLIDVVVATSGSSPAYYFLFTELLAQLATEHGLPSEVALKLAEEAFIGSALNKAGSTHSLEDLRAMVTSEKGTAYEALQKFKESDNLYKLLKSAFEAAIRRSQEGGSR